MTLIQRPPFMSVHRTKGLEQAPQLTQRHPRTHIWPLAPLRFTKWSTTINPLHFRQGISHSSLPQRLAGGRGVRAPAPRLRAEMPVPA